MRRAIQALALGVVMIACSEGPTVVPFTYTQVFTGETQKSWRIRNYQFVERGKGTQTGGLATCEADNLFTFYNNPEHSYTITEGSKKCNASDPNTVASSSWSFVNAGAVLTIIMPLLSDNPLPFVVKEVKSTSMTIEIYFEDGNSSYRFNFTAVDSE